MTTMIGDVPVTRIEEILGPGFEPQQLLLDWTPEILKEHGHWMTPNYYDQASNKFISSIHSWLIRTRHHTILVDTCCGNFKNRPGAPRFHNLNTPYLDRLRAAGVEPEDVDYVLCTHLHVDHVGWNTQLKDAVGCQPFRTPNMCSRKLIATTGTLRKIRTCPNAAS